MPIVAGNEPPSPQRKPGSLLSWIFPLLFFGPMIYNIVRSFTRGVLTDQQLLIVGGGLIGLVALVAIGRRVGQRRTGADRSLPTSYTPPPAMSVRDIAPLSRATPPPSAAPQYRAQQDRPVLPSPPRFEPIITGKVVLVGLVLAALMGGIGFLLLSASF